MKPKEQKEGRRKRAAPKPTGRPTGRPKDTRTDAEKQQEREERERAALALVYQRIDELARESGMSEREIRLRKRLRGDAT